MRRFPWWAAGFLTLLILIAALVPWLGLHDPYAIATNRQFAPPTWDHPLGLDELGRDVLSRLLWGSRTSLSIALASATVGLIVGSLLGMLGGFLRSFVEPIILRATDALLCFPPVLLSLLVVTLCGVGFSTLIPLMGFIFMPGFIRVAYSSVLTVRSQDYVEAMRVLGAAWPRIIAGAILPNIAGPLLVQFSLAVSAAITLEAGLSFIGLGVAPPTPTWGGMIGAGRNVVVQAPLHLLWPCLALTLTIISVNMFCDGLRDVLDPQSRPARAARRSSSGPAPMAAPSPGLLVQGLSVEIATDRGTIMPVKDISFAVAPGRTLALVGESGSGKSLTGLALTGLLPTNAVVSSGAAWLDGTELLHQEEAKARKLRGKSVAMVFQDPASSLNPVQRIGAQIGEMLRLHDPADAGPVSPRVVRLLERVGIPDPARRARAYPHELSGGMRQRVMIAMAIANNPRLIIADEPTTALDVTIQAQILELLAELQREHDLALIFITHSLPVVAEIADTVAVMYAGELVEYGAVDQVFARPLHPYTRALLASAATDDGAPPAGIPGQVPAFTALPPGCRFATRCPNRQEVCETTAPSLREVVPGRETRCLRWKELA
ncbi:MAG: dipeptide/oligopeptide/nickel ABC transporter permease/ATP-binding protein [Acetobacteraceae bacterium]